MKLAIVGAGPAGLEVLRHALQGQNFKCTVFERSDKIGGIWNYTENIVKDKWGLPVHSSIYGGMKTNLPKEIMEFENFPYKRCKDSFIPHEQVLEYIHRYCKYFNLKKHIKFLNKVTCIKPAENNKWNITCQDINSGAISAYTFDAVVVSTGHYYNPYLPRIPGMNHFKEKSIHSHVYRRPNNYKNKKVLLIGGGPSGIDISQKLSAWAKAVYLSGKPVFNRVEENIIRKPRVKFFTENEAVFEDDSKEAFDNIIYCTGYNTIFPFIAPECGITVTGKHCIKPLYKHLVNIEHPTMAFINITIFVPSFILFGIQARFFLALLNGKVGISKKEMYEDLEKDTDARRKNGLSVNDTHLIGQEKLENYCNDLASTAKIYAIPKVLYKIFKHYVDNDAKMVNYKIINENEFSHE